MNIARLRWNCRRGMLELDLLLLPFLEQKFTNLTPAEQQLFEELLTEEDQDLYNWLIGHLPPPLTHYHALLTQIRTRA